MKWLALALAVLCIATPANGASFDCAKAATKVEHIICDNPDISKLDDELARDYRAAVGSARDSASVIAPQKQWLRSRDGCADAACVLQHYEARLPVLRDLGRTTHHERADNRNKLTTYKYDSYRVEYQPGAVDPDEEPDPDEVAARPFCRAVIDALNKAKPAEDYRPCVMTEVLKMPGVSNPPWQKLDLSGHEALAKEILGLRSASMRVAYPKGALTADQLQRELKRIESLGAEMDALKLPAELSGGRVLVTLRYTDQLCGLSSSRADAGEHARSAWVTPDLSRVAKESGNFTPMAGRPILYQGKIYLIEPNADGLDVFIPFQGIEGPVCSIALSVSNVPKEGESK